MKIHGIVYVIVGIILVGVSYYITSVNKTMDLQKFMLFIWAGYIFILIGAAKIIFRIMSRPRKPKLAKENFHHNTPSGQSNLQHTQHNKQQQPSQLVKFCSHCGSTVRHFDNFCYKCGNRMFHKR